MKSIVFKSYGAIAIAGLWLFVGSMANAVPTGKIDICHKPGDISQRILNVNPSSLPGHVGHGDYVVEPEVCDGVDSDCEKPPVADNGVDCSDGIACTVDSCAGVAGCFNDPDNFLCDDSDPNTLDECSIADGGCVNTPIAFCGDGIVDPGEECDDGNNDDGDGCSATCTVEAVCPGFCALGGEPCDDINTCVGLGDFCVPDDSCD